MFLFVVVYVWCSVCTRYSCLASMEMMLVFKGILCLTSVVFINGGIAKFYFFSSCVLVRG